MAPNVKNEIAALPKLRRAKEVDANWLVRVPRPLLVVSPHFDDVLLSANALLHLDRPLTVLTVFSGGPEEETLTDWDEKCGFASSVTAMKDRRREDDAAFVGLRAQRLFVGLRETQYLTNGKRIEDTPEPFLQAIREWFETHPDGDIALPAGSGGELTLVHRLRHKLPHATLGLPGGSEPSPEHLWVTEQALPLVPSTSTVLLYQEYPYRWVSANEERTDSLSASFRRPAIYGYLPVNNTDKARRLAAYVSQLRLVVAPWFKLRKHLPPTEGVVVLGPVI